MLWRTSGLPSEALNQPCSPPLLKLRRASFAFRSAYCEGWRRGSRTTVQAFKILKILIRFKTWKREEVEEAELRSAIRKPGALQARTLFCQIAVKKIRYFGAELARYLGMTTSAVHRRAGSKELPELADYINWLKSGYAPIHLRPILPTSHPSSF